jgi:serine/threonine protein kinase
MVGGRYRLVGKLGSGGYGHVWHARDTVLDVDVAVKQLILPADLPEAGRIERLTRARREAANAARLRGNPNIVVVHDLVIDEGRPWLIMELIRGQSLAQHMAGRGPLAAEEATQIARAMLSALKSAHAADIVHRDVKPANVMLSADGRIVLTDFGISMLTSDDSVTMAGQFVGSVDYVAPERITGAKAGPASDLFSLGALLYHLVEGRPPFARGSVTATIDAVLYDQPVPSPSAGRLAPLISALLNKDPAARPTAEQALATLDPRDNRTTTLTFPAIGPGDDQEPARPPRRGRILLLSGCVLVLAVGAGITALAASPHSAAPPRASDTRPRHPAATPSATASPAVTGPTALASWLQTGTFNGSGTSISLPDVALNTGAGASFTVSAWVYLTSTSAFATAVSQEGMTNSSFYLQYSQTDNAWAFSRVSDDAQGAAGIRALSSGPPATNQWVHLVGVYNAPNGLMTLYVNGDPQGTATDTTPFAGQAGILIGRAQYDGNPSDWFPGMIKNVEVYQQALSATQVAALP